MWAFFIGKTMSNLGSLVVSLEANIVQFQSDLGKAAAVAEQRAKEMDKAFALVKSSLSALGVGFAFGATFDTIKSKIEGVIESTAGLQQLSERTGATVESLSGLVGIAKLSGTGTDQLAVGLQKLSKSMVDAENGGQKTGESFKAIGISVADLQGKKPDQVFQMVAKSLADYKDGAEKLVVTQNLLGKSGSDLLPMLTDLASAGDMQVKATAAQAEQADNLEKNQIRLQASTNAIYKKIGMELIPVFDAFTKALLDAQNANDGVRGAVDGLAKDGSIREWAEDAVKVAGFVVDAFDGVSRVVQIVGKGLGADAAAVMAVMHGDFSEAKSIMQAHSDDVEKILGKTLFSDRLAQQLSKSNTTPVEAVVRKTIDTSGFGNANKGPKDDPAKAEMEGILKNQEAFISRAKKLAEGYQQDLDYYGRLQYMTEADVLDNKKLVIEKELAASEAAYAIELAAANKYIEHEKALGNQQGQQAGKNQRQEILNKQAAAELESEQKIAKILEDRAAIRRKFDLGTMETARVQTLANAAAKFQIDMLGKDTLEVQKLTAARTIQLALDERIRQLQLSDPTVDTSQAIADAAIQTASAQALITESYEKQRTAAFGANEAFRKYAEDAGNEAAHMENAMTGAFKGMEDALVNFVKTGKLDFSSLADSIISDMIRMMIQQSIMKPLTLGFQSGGFGGMLSAGATLLGFAGGGDPPVGVPSIVGEHGPELFIPKASGTIIPNGASAVGSSGQAQPLTVKQYFTVGDVASISMVRQAVAGSERRIAAGIGRSMQYGGAMSQ